MRLLVMLGRRLRTMLEPVRLALVAAAGGLLLAGCGGSESAALESATTTEQGARLVKAGLRKPAGCFVTVFLREDVTPAQRRSVQSLMLASKRVLTVAFVSKALSLERLAQTQPDYARSLRTNPFPPQFEVVPRTRIDVFGLIADFSAGVDGVTNVRASRPCAASA
jgi:hypothetical protein